MYFVRNCGLEATQHQYNSTWYYKTSFACVPSYIYSLYSHTKITAHTNKNNFSINIYQVKVKYDSLDT